MPSITEISFELPSDEVAVLDGYCQAKDIKRTTAFRAILREWSERKLHEATLICRVAGVNPTATGSVRGRSESRPGEV